MSNTFLVVPMILCVISLMDTSTARAGGDQQLLEFVRDAHRATRECLQTFSCSVEFSLTPRQRPVTQSCSSRFWFSKNMMRAKISEEGQNTDNFWENAVRKSVLHEVIEGQQTVGASRNSFTNRHYMRCDPFVRGLLVFPIPNTIDFLRFEELLERATRFIKAERKTIDGKEMILVQLFFDSTKETYSACNLDIYFDSTVNYLARQIVTSRPKYRWTDEVLEFKEYQPGFFFPDQVIGSVQNLPSKEKYAVAKTIFSDVQINQLLPKDIFDFKYPHGIILRDNIRGSDYRVDADGNRISEETPYEREATPLIKDRDVQVPGAETQEEPRSATRWILPMSVGILIIAGVAAVIRWRKSQAESV